MRTVVSVSMSPEMATRLKSSAAEQGQSFSARVCELLEAGEVHEVLVERMDEGLFAQTETELQSDDPEGFAQGGHKDEDGGFPSTTGSSRSAAPNAARSPRPEIKPSEEAVDDSRRSEESVGPAEQESEEVEADTPHKAVAVKTGRPPLPAPAELLTVTERVYACVTTEKTSVRKIAAQARVSEVEAGEVLERLIDQDGEPIVLSRSGGDWVCWVEAA